MHLPITHSLSLSLPPACSLAHSHGQDLTSKEGAEMKGRKRGLEEVPTFFGWFSDTESTSDPIAEIIKDDIWPNPLPFYIVRH